MNSKTNKKLPLKKYPFYFYILALLIPILFFLLLEFFLVFVNYGASIPQWITLSEKFPDILVLNPNIAKRYFQVVDSPPAHNYDGFQRVKDKNAFRVFVLGGSSAAGFPYTINGAFSRYIDQYLRIKYPDSKIEMINIAITAVSTYTLKDLLPGVIEQKPDLIIFYTGHNEYYGALGVGSTEFLGNSRHMVNLILKLQKYRVVQLIKDILIQIKNIYATVPHNRSEKTLMARMVGGQLIPLNSNMFFSGLKQFEGNMREMIDLLKEENIPVLIGTVVSNLKDQRPFVSLDTDTLPAAEEIYTQAQKEYSEGNFKSAYQLFIKAKELDALRFRAPDKINQIILKLRHEYEIPVVSIDSVFRENSPNEIPGNNLMIDHVHPNIAGYYLIGKTFIKMMEKTGNIPVTRQINKSIQSIFQKVEKEYPLTRLDSLQANIRIQILKSGWPFVEDNENNLSNIEFYPEDYIDTLALDLTLEEINWEKAHLKAALWYKKQNRITEFTREINALIRHTPFNHSLYNILIDVLIQKGKIEEAYPYLIKLHKIHPNAFSGKWLGAYYLVKKNYENALRYLEFSLELNKNDSQLLYNLAGAYTYNKMFEKALTTVEKCLKINPDYPGAKILYRSIKNIDQSQQ